MRYRVILELCGSTAHVQGDGHNARQDSSCTHDLLIVCCAKCHCGKLVLCPRTTSGVPTLVPGAHSADARLRRVSLCRWPLAERTCMPVHVGSTCAALNIAQAFHPFRSTASVMKYAAPSTLALRASLIAKVYGWYIAWRQRRATDGHSAKPSVGPRDHARVCGGSALWDTRGCAGAIG